MRDVSTTPGRPVWAGPAAAGWRPTTSDVRRGLACHGPARQAVELVPGSRESAVLILVVPGAEARAETGSGTDTDTETGSGSGSGSGTDADVVLIERSRSRGTHRGDIAFPGGVLAVGEHPLQAALRETAEEIGVRADDVEVVAEFDGIATLTGFVIAPFVGICRRRPTFVVDPVELERVLVVPLAHLVAAGAHWYQPWNDDPASAQPFFAVADTVAWGATGTLLEHLLTATAAGRRPGAVTAR